MTTPKPTAPAAVALLIPLALTGLSACSQQQRTQQVNRRLEAARQGLGDDPAVRAAAAQGEAALARERGSSMWEGIELRANDLSAANMGQGEGVQFEARLKMRNPWEVAAEHRARQAETDVALSELEETALDRRSGQCLLAMDGAAFAEAQELFAWYQSRLQGVLEWNAQCREAGTVNELAGARVELQATAGLAKRQPRPVEGTVNPRYPLPGVASRENELVRDPALIREKVGLHQPAVAGRQAAAAHYRALAERAQRRRIPWVGFVEVSYELGAESGPEDIAGQVSLDIPFGIGEAAEARRYDALSRSEELEATAAIEEQGQLALAALRDIAHFEDRSGQLEGLDQMASQAQTLAESWLSDRLGQPSDVARLLDEAYEARASIIASRLRAGQAGCLLFEATGLDPTEWPRTSVD